MYLPISMSVIYKNFNVCNLLIQLDNLFLDLYSPFVELNVTICCNIQEQSNWCMASSTLCLEKRQPLFMYVATTQTNLPLLMRAGNECEMLLFKLYSVF